VPKIQAFDWEKAKMLKNLGLNEDSELFKSLFNNLFYEVEVSEEYYQKIQDKGIEISKGLTLK
jgi:DNA primase catalytic subunit